ncbi:MAG: hypothetical protein ACK56I_15825, partial [bacterium]
PISWYSKSFTAQQILKYDTLEKETLELDTTIMNFRYMIESAQITFIITDSQPSSLGIETQRIQFENLSMVFNTF